VQSHFRVTAHTEGRTRVLAISGELDLAAAPTLEAELDRALAAGCALIVLDLKELDFIDSTGLSALVRGHQQAREAGIELGIVNPGAQAERLLSLTGLTERLTLANGTGELPPAA
jgi:anti-sigma B factor antagonist